MKNPTVLSADYLRSILKYDPNTGAFQWLVKRNGVRTGAERAGSLDRHGHRQLRIDGQILFAHRLAWLYMTGEWPTKNIDHINGARDDNRWANLRDTTQSINLQNRRNPQSNNTSGFLGVSWDGRSGKWLATIKATKRQWLGLYETPVEAYAAYLEAKRRLHPGCSI